MSKIETITKEKITDLLKKKIGFSSLLCEEITNSIFSGIFDLSLSSKKLVLPNFGKFQVYNKEKRPGLNLQTGIAIEIKPRRVLRFNPSRSLKEKVNSYEFN
jgi:nucleoid DNA-binding protein